MMNEQQQKQFEEVVPLVDTLFELSSEFVVKYGDFLPHGAFVNSTGQIALCGAAPEEEMTNSEEVLPLLHDGLREQTSDFSTCAVAVSESVFIGEEMTSAIKVLVEHREGLTLALYITWRKRLLRGPSFGEVQMRIAEPEVGNWKQVFTI